jgi:hypothetical protein
MGAYISRPGEATVGTTVGPIARGLGGGVGLGDCAGKKGTWVRFSAGTAASLSRMGRGSRGSECRFASGIGSVVRGSCCATQWETL